MNENKNIPSRIYKYNYHLESVKQHIVSFQNRNKWNWFWWLFYMSHPRCIIKPKVMCDNKKTSYQPISRLWCWCCHVIRELHGEVPNSRFYVMGRLWHIVFLLRTIFTMDLNYVLWCRWWLQGRSECPSKHFVNLVVQNLVYNLNLQAITKY